MAKDSKGHGSNGKGGGTIDHFAESQRLLKERGELLKAGKHKEAADTMVKAREHADEANYQRRSAARSEGAKKSDAKASAPINKRGDTFTPKYNKASVDKGIDSAYRGQKPPTAKQRAVTHALLKGRD
jgi:hypothetical protein